MDKQTIRLRGDELTAQHYVPERDIPSPKGNICILTSPNVHPRKVQLEQRVDEREQRESVYAAVEGDESSPIIIAASRDISPMRSEEILDERSALHFRRCTKFQSRTLSPQQRYTSKTVPSHETMKSLNYDDRVRYHQLPDAQTEPLSNDTFPLKCDSNVESSSTELLSYHEIPNTCSMTSTITSIVSNNDAFGEASNFLPKSLRMSHPPRRKNGDPKYAKEAFTDTRYDGLKTTRSPYDLCATPLKYNLSGVLRDSPSDAASVFHGFRNPNATHCHLRNNDIPDNLKESATEPISSGFVDSDIYKHSILQLCTEDLMSDHPDIVHSALIRLCDVCCHSTNVCTNEAMKPSIGESSASSVTSSVALNRIRFIKAGGHAFIVGVMKKYNNHEQIQSTACQLIHQLVVLDNDSQNVSIGKRSSPTGAFNELFSAVHGMDSIISAIQRFCPLSEAVNPSTEFDRSTMTHAETHSEHRSAAYNFACGALVAIVCSSFSMVDRLIQHERSNISIFLSAIRTSLNRKVVGVNRVLHYVLKHYSEYSKDIVMSGGIEEILREMQQYPESLEVQYCGCSVLGILAKLHGHMTIFSSSTNRSVVEYIVDLLNGAHWIASAMKLFPLNEDVQGKAILAFLYLTNVMSVSTSKVTVVKAAIKKVGGLSAIVIALENFPKNQCIQETGCIVIKKLLETTAVPEAE